MAYDKKGTKGSMPTGAHHDPFGEADVGQDTVDYKVPGKMPAPAAEWPEAQKMFKGGTDIRRFIK